MQEVAYSCTSDREFLDFYLGLPLEISSNPGVLTQGKKTTNTDEYIGCNGSDITSLSAKVISSL